MRRLLQAARRLLAHSGTARPAHSRQGDAARDAGRWAEAASHYRAHLAAHPADAGIAVQLGHALKEAGDLTGAEAAYRAAAALRPDDPDPPLHLGHALKLQGRLPEAREAYRLADALAPVNHAAIELEALGDASPAPRIRAPRVVSMPGPDLAALRAAFLARPERGTWLALRDVGGDAEADGRPGGPHLFDVTDLLVMLRQVGRATGIQRVQLGLCRHLLEADGARCRFVALDSPLGAAWTLQPADLQALIRYATAEPHDLPRARALVEAALDRAAWTHLPSARLFFVMGAFWFYSGATAMLDRLRAAGLRIGVLAYDMIPLTHPEHTSAGTVAAFRQALEEGASRWDFSLAISEHTAEGMRRALGGAIPVRAVPLAHRFNEGEAATWPAALGDLEGQPFILCVGTIESRKNHLALFQAWKLLLAEGDAPLPLVLVGRPGWRVDDLLAQLDATGHLDGRIRVVHDISDPELVALYRACRFSVFPSFTEGWGLPVGESLALGKLCLASTEGATPEAAGGFAVPLDPFSPRQIAAEVRRFLHDPAALAAAEARIAVGFRPRGWTECGQDFLARLEECLALPSTQAVSAPPTHAPGQRLGFPAASALLGPGFLPPAEGIAWMAGRTASLRIATTGPAQAILHLAVRGPGRLATSVNDAPPRWQSLPGEGEARALLELPGGEAAILLHLASGGCGLRGLALLPAMAASVPPRQPIRFGAGGDPLLWAPLTASGFDLAGTGPGLPAASAEAVLRLPVAAKALRLLLVLEGEGTVLHPGGETPIAPTTLLALTPTGGEVQVTLRPAGALRLHALQWAAEDDLEGRLALLETAAASGSLAERLDALETRRPPPALPGGEAGRIAQRLLG